MSSSETTRRLAAILIADVVGYSRLMAADETGTRAAFNTVLDTIVSPLLTQHGGRLVKQLGDGLLIEFPSILDAAACAVDWQRQMVIFAADQAVDRKLSFRIGLNLGDIIIEGDDIHGDGVNIAARIEPLADPGGIALSRPARDQLRGRIPHEMRDMGDVSVKNMAKPLRVFKLAADGLPALPAEAAPNATRVAPRRFVIGAIAACLLAATLYLGWSQLQVRRDAQVIAGFDLPLPDKPSVAVMPFRSQDDQDLDLQAEAIVRDVASNLARVSGLFVISSSATFQYKGKTVAPRDIASEFGVRNVVQGSVRGSAGSLAVSVEIIDGVTGGAIWNGQFRQTNRDTYALKEEISNAIARELEWNIPRNSVVGRSTTSEAAYMLWFRAAREIDKGPSVENFAYAQTLAESALALDPDFSRALAVSAYVDSQNGYFRYVPAPEAALQSGLAKARKAADQSPDDWFVQEMLAFSLMNIRAYKDAVEAFDEAIRLAPSSDTTLVRSALPLLFLGRATEAETRLLTALRLNPLYNWAPINFLGMAYYQQERYVEAVEKLDESHRLKPGFVGNLIWRAAAHAQVGDIAAAKAAAAELLDKAPNWTISTNFVQIKHAPTMARLNDGLRKAGLPE